MQWDEQDRLAPLADILRVHEWPYVRRIQARFPCPLTAIHSACPQACFAFPDLTGGCWVCSLRGC